jgi:hypothetical protein
VDDAVRQILRPTRLQEGELGRDKSGKPRLDRIGASPRHFGKPAPTVNRQCVGASERKVAARLVHGGKRTAESSAVKRLRTAHPQPLQERSDHRRPAGDAAERLAVAAPDRQRAVDAAPGEMLHQAEEKGQVAFGHALLV